MMIINLGLDSGFGGLEAIYSALADEINVIKSYRKTFLALIHFILFLGSLPTATYGGMYLVTFLDTFSTSPALMVIVFFEAFSVCWIYGMDKFSTNIYEMCKIKPNWFWKFCWKFVCPLIILTLFVVSILFFEEPVVNDYKYPKAYIALGWSINMSILLPIPAYILYKYIRNSLQKN
jgi:solute carrier family 6 serotonin transporter-like protein 4